MKTSEKAPKPYGFWNWGTGIAITIIVSASLMIFLVYQSMNVKFDMAEKDYYGEEVKYNGKLQARQNANALSAEVSVMETNDQLVITFPEECVGEKIEGTLVLYRPSSENQDLALPFTPDKNGQIIISKEKLVKGKYQLKADWHMNNIHYNVQEDFYITLNDL